MKHTLQDLASMITVRNHIMVVLNDVNVTGKNDYRPLDTKRKEIDKLFVKTLLDTDLDSLSVSDSASTPVSINLQEWKSAFEEASKDPDFKAFTHGVAAEIEKQEKIDGVQLDLPLDETQQVSSVAPSVDEVAEKVASVSGTAEKLEKVVDNLAEQNVSIEPAVVEKAAEAIKAPVEAKEKVVRKSEDLSGSLADDPDFKKRLAEEKKAVSATKKKTTKKKTAKKATSEDSE